MAVRGDGAVVMERSRPRLVGQVATAVALVAASLGSVTPPASAAEHEHLVTSSADDGGAGTLRSALEMADTGDIIRFDEGLEGETIQLVERHLPITVPVHIEGPRSGDLTIAAPEAGPDNTDATDDRVFVVDVDAPGAVVIISHVMITGGDVDGGGGGILVPPPDAPDVEAPGAEASASVLRLDHVVLDDNHATGDGGGLFLGNGSLEMTHSTVSANTAGTGGGLGIVGTSGDVTISSTRIGGDDLADGNVSGSGGGVALVAVGGHAAITGSSISNNSGNIGGGLLHVGSESDGPAEPEGAPDLVIEETSIRRNTSDTGGGVAVVAGAATITRSLIDDNHGELGGGIAGVGSGPIHIAGTTISNNDAGPAETDAGLGGGLAMVDSVLTLVNSTVSGNTAGEIGGGLVLVDGSSLIESSTVASNASEDMGGGLFALGDGEGAAYALRNSVLADNTATGEGDDLAGANLAGTVDVDHSLIENPAGVFENVDGTISGQDPDLGELADNGGPTPTHLPSRTSPVVDAGGSTDLVQDQRGHLRVVRGAADMGSVEVQSPIDLPPISLPATDAPPCEDAGDAGFSDVGAGNVHEAAIDCLAHLGVTTGGPGDGSASEYGPELGVTRGQMASFLARLLGAAGVELPEDPADAFADDDGSVHERAIDQLAAVSIVEGLEDGTYGQAMFVRRDQMASFLRRTYDFVSEETLAAGEDAFDDDDDSVHEAAINALAEVGVIEGTGTPGAYDPSGDVRRDQMASFLVRLADLLASEGNFPID